MKSYNNSNIKSVFCRMVSNGCKFGKNCRFAHSSIELTPRSCPRGTECSGRFSRCSCIHEGEDKNNLISRLGWISPTKTEKKVPTKTEKKVPTSPRVWYAKVGNRLTGPYSTALMRNMRSRVLRTNRKDDWRNLPISTNPDGPFQILVDVFDDPTNEVATNLKKKWKYTNGEISSDKATMFYCDAMLEVDDDIYDPRHMYQLSLIPGEAAKADIKVSNLKLKADYQYSYKSRVPSVVKFAEVGTNFAVKGEKKSMRSMSITDDAVKTRMNNWIVINEWNKDYAQWVQWERDMKQLSRMKRFDFDSWKALSVT